MGKGRGALLGPEESGHGSSDSWIGFSGSLLHRIFADLGVAVWLGPALTKLLVMMLQGVVCFPREGLSEGSGGLGLVFLPVF